MSFEDIDPIEQQKMKKRSTLDNPDTINDAQDKKRKSTEERIDAFVNGLSEGSGINTHEGRWEVTSVRENEKGEKIIYRKKGGREANITAEALKREISESEKIMPQESRGTKKPDKTTTPEREKTEEEKKEIEEITNEEKKPDSAPEEKLEDKARFEASPDGDIKDRKEEAREKVELGRTSEYIEESNLELSEETLGKWSEYLKERHYVLLSNIAREFCEKNGLTQEDRENDSAFHIQQFKEKDGLSKLPPSEKERLEKMERLQDVLEIHGQQMTIDERYLLLHFGEERITRLQDVSKEKKSAGSDVVQEKTETEKVRDMQADILSETLKGKDREEDFKRKTYEKTYEELRKEYENEGRSEEFEIMLAKQRGEKVKLGKGERGREDEFIERKEEKYHRILGEEISEIVGDREKAKGGIEKWYGEIKENILNDLVGKLDKGEFKGKLASEKEPKNEAEENSMLSETLSKIAGKEIPEEKAKQGKERLKKMLGKGWEGTKKVCGLLGMVILLYSILVGLLGLAITSKMLGIKKSEGKR